MRSTVLAFLLLSARGGVAALAAWLVCRALRRARALREALKPPAHEVKPQPRGDAEAACKVHVEVVGHGGRRNENVVAGKDARTFFTAPAADHPAHELPKKLVGIAVVGFNQGCAPMAFWALREQKTDLTRP